MSNANWNCLFRGKSPAKTNGWGTTGHIVDDISNLFNLLELCREWRYRQLYRHFMLVTGMVCRVTAPRATG
jgi:hypothetical protein